MVAVDTGVSMVAATKGGLPTPAADGTKPEIDAGDLLVYLNYTQSLKSVYQDLS